jgi:glycine/D-amino acid oxidase-like deaminating enzyme
MSVTADIAVIGAGIVGTSAAYQLAQSGHDVLVLDKAAGPGDGSTSASSAVVRFEYSRIETAVTAWESSFYWENLRDYLEAPAGETLAQLYRNGVLILDSPSFTHDYLRQLFARLGVAYTEYHADALAAAYPGIDPGCYWPPKLVDSEEFWDDAAGRLGGVLTPEGGFVDDPRLACANFARAAERKGARTRFGARVVAMSRGQGAGPWHLALSDGTAVEAPQVLNAAGPWSGEVLALAGAGAEFRIRTRPLRQEVHAVAAAPGFNPPGGLGPAVADEDLGYYLRPEPSGSFIVGGTEPECDGLDWVEGPVDDVDMNRSPEKFTAQVTRAARRWPGLAIPPRPAGVVGVYDAADDWTAILDKTDLPGYFVGIGTSGNCFKHGPVFGEYLDALVRAAEGGVDHDVTPVTWTGPRTGLTVDLSFFSRLREPRETSGGVSG